MAAGDSRVIAGISLLCRKDAGKEQVAIRHGGEDRLDIRLAGAVVTHRAADQYKITNLHLRLESAAAADADQVLDSEIFELLHGDSGGSPADSGGQREHADALIAAHKAAVFTVIGKLLYIA
ncbi:hypothetical protein SDC9_113440 [bioreactor metagenome]|uniref:Uncharacterized protein n=1 Tax=bioreactor metagenome TaxID=1076179 RepID=A0A645BPM1_9ZZZZ